MVWFLRHSQSTHNLSGLNEKDCGLSEHGKLQAKTLDGRFDVVICSPLRRCRETLAFSNITYTSLIISHLCREQRTEECDFLVSEEMSFVESESEMLIRVQDFRAFLEVTKAANPGSSICVVTHADFVFYLSAYRLDGELFGQWLQNGEFIELD